MSRPSLLRAAAVILLLLSPAGASARPAPDKSLLAKAGVGFPETLGEFRLVGTNSVEPGRINATYRNGTDALAEIYVATAAGSVEEEFASTEGMIGRVFSDLRPVRDLAPPPSAPSAKGRLWSGVSGSTPVYTAMMLDHRKGWRIKIRGTTSQAQGETGAAALEKFMRDYSWWR